MDGNATWREMHSGWNRKHSYWEKTSVKALFLLKTVLELEIGRMARAIDTVLDKMLRCFKGQILFILHFT